MPRPLTVAERARLLASQRVIDHALRVRPGPDESPAQAIAEAQRARYPDLGLAPQDAEAFAVADTRRVLVYRKLVRATLKGVIALEIPRAVARMGERAYETALDDWLTDELPRSQVLRDVAYEFVAWASPRWRADDTLPAYLADLARYELFEFDVYTAERRPHDIGEPTEDLAADQVLAFEGTTRIARFDFAVHELADDPADRTEPAVGSRGVLAYRDPAGRFRQMDLTPLATTILEATWRHGAPLAAAVQRACAAHGRAVDQSVIAGTSQVLEDLSERGVVLGGIAAAPPPPSPWAHWLFAGEGSTEG